MKTFKGGLENIVGRIGQRWHNDKAAFALKVGAAGVAAVMLAAVAGCAPLPKDAYFVVDTEPAYTTNREVLAVQESSGSLSIEGFITREEHFQTEKAVVYEIDVIENDGSVYRLSMAELKYDSAAVASISQLDEAIGVGSPVTISNISPVAREIAMKFAETTVEGNYRVKIGPSQVMVRQ